MASKPRRGGDSNRSGALPAYDPLMDPNLRHFFSNIPVQKRLVEAGLIDVEGRILDRKAASGTNHGANADALAAAKEQELLAKEETELRRKVRELRMTKLVAEQNARKMGLFREEERIRADIVKLMKDGGASSPSSTSNSSPSVDGRSIARLGAQIGDDTSIQYTGRESLDEGEDGAEADRSAVSGRAFAVVPEDVAEYEEGEGSRPALGDDRGHGQVGSEDGVEAAPTQDDAAAALAMLHAARADADAVPKPSTPGMFAKREQPSELGEPQ